MSNKNFHRDTVSQAERDDKKREERRLNSIALRNARAIIRHQAKR